MEALPFKGFYSVQAGQNLELHVVRHEREEAENVPAKTLVTFFVPNEQKEYVCKRSCIFFLYALLRRVTYQEAVVWTFSIIANIYANFHEPVYDFSHSKVALR